MDRQARRFGSSSRRGTHRSALRKRKRLFASDRQIADTSHIQVATGQEFKCLYPERSKPTQVGWKPSGCAGVGQGKTAATGISSLERTSLSRPAAVPSLAKSARSARVIGKTVRPTQLRRI